MSKTKKKATKNSPSANPSTLPRPGDPIRKAFPIGSKIPGLLSPQDAKGHAAQRVWTVAQSYSAKKDWGIDLDTKTIASRDLRLMIRKQGDRVKFTLITPIGRYYLPNNAEIDIKKGTVVSLKYGGENMDRRYPVPTVLKHEASVHEIVASGIIWAAETVDLHLLSQDGIHRVNGYVPRHEDLVSAVASNIGKRSPSHVEIIVPNLLGEWRVFPAKQNKKNPKRKSTKRKANRRKPVKKNASELEGPFTFPNGRVVYYDPGEGKYYDRSNDLYLSESEVESMQSGSKQRAKKNPSRQAGGFYIVDTRVGKVVAGPYSVREADMTLEESAGYDHATHQVMDERYLADLAFKAKRNPGKKKVAKKKATKAWSARDIKGMQEFADRKLGTKKKVGGFTAAQKKKLRLGWGQGHPDSMISEIVLSKPIRAIAIYRKGSKWGSGVVDRDGKLIRMVEVFKRPSAFSAAKAAEDIVLEKTPKKKVAKKKATRKKTPEWQLLCNRCAKLWDHYCERPSKTRLKPVLEHLEKMKASTSKRVADERKACLRVANKEARRLKMK